MTPPDGAPDEFVGRLKTWAGKRGRRVLRRDPDAFIGDDWWQLRPSEIDAFMLRPGDMARIVPVFEIYEALCTGGNTGFRRSKTLYEAAQGAFPWLPQGKMEPQSFRKFAALFGIEDAEAWCFFHKFMFWQVRHNCVFFSGLPASARRSGGEEFPDGGDEEGFPG